MVIGRFENVRLIPFNVGVFRKGAAVTIPGIGIIAGDAGIRNQDLLQHEFGHILQYRKWGFLFYWTRIAPSSLMSASKAGRDKSWHHMKCWTEWSANRLSYLFFNSPVDWDLNSYPLNPPSYSLAGLPERVKQYFKIYGKV